MKKLLPPALAERLETHLQGDSWEGDMSGRISGTLTGPVAVMMVRHGDLDIMNRIVACLNACIGVSTEELMAMDGGTIRDARGTTPNA